MKQTYTALTPTWDAAANAIAALVATDISNGHIEVRTGAMPASPETAASGTLLASYAIGTATVSAAIVSVVAANAPTDDADPPVTGTPGWARIYDSDGAPVLDMDCGTSDAAPTIPTRFYTLRFGV